MNGFDIGLLILLGILVIVGVLKGLTRILVGIAALVAAFVLASRLHGQLAPRLEFAGFGAEMRGLLAYLLIFLATMLAGGLIAFLTRKLLKAAMLSWADRLAGAALGLVAALLIAALLVLPLVAYSPFGEQALRGSVLAPYVTVVADVADMLVPETLSEKYRQKRDNLRRYWRQRWEQESVAPESSGVRGGSAVPRRA